MILSPLKNTDVWRKLDIYIKNDCTIFIEQRFYLQVISAKCEDWSKALIVIISPWGQKMKK